MPHDASLRVCSMCGKVYGPDFADTFCTCGFELVAASAGAGTVPAPAPQPTPAPVAAPNRPPPGTRCLVLYGPDKAPVRYFALTKDVTTIGRQDPVEANFPDIDLGECLEEATARRVSRQHALILRSRITGSFSLRALPGNTGTQLEADMVAAEQDFPLHHGQRLVLGGAVRLKFEIV